MPAKNEAFARRDLRASTLRSGRLEEFDEVATVEPPKAALKVLLVEDSEDDAELVLRELRRGGYEVDYLRVQTRSSMRRALEESAFDLIISDFSMPEFSAPHALSVLHESHQDIPFIIISGTIGEEAAVDSLRSGAHDFLVKGRLARLSPTIERELREVETRRKRREAEDALRISEERFRTLVTSMDDIVFTLDKQQKYDGVFGGWLEREGFTEAHFLGKTTLELMGEEAARVHEAANLRALSGERVVYEWSVDSAQGTRHYQTRLSPRHSATGEVTGLVAVGREITEQRQIQAQLAISDRMASIGMLSAGVAHEINNPLAAVIANVDMALSALKRLPLDIDTPALRDVLDGLRDARDASARIRAIVRDLKLLSRAEEEAREPVDINGVLDSALAMARVEIRHRARVVKDYAVLPAVLGSESRLCQVFLNLLVNAAQAMPEGHAESNEIRVATRVGDAGRIQIEIRDSGCGMDADVVRHLFTPFFTTKASNQGTGLGLSICQRIISALGGEIGVESKVDQGTAFTIRLPAAAEAAPIRRPSLPSVARSARRGRVLVIDDERLVAATLKRALDRDHDVETTDDPAAALTRIIQGERFDVILCDLIMPHMTGMDFHAGLCEGAPDQVTNVMFLTGGAFTARAREFMDRVDNQLLEKPFDIALLRATVNARIDALP